MDEKQQYSIKVTRVIEGHEPFEFRSLFRYWPDTALPLSLETSSSTSSAASASSSLGGGINPSSTSSSLSNGGGGGGSLSGSSSTTSAAAAVNGRGGDQAVIVNAMSAMMKSFSLTSMVKSSSPTTSFDASLLAANPQLAADAQLVDDGKAHKQIWYAHSGDIHRLAELHYGEFHSADCYLVDYKYAVNRVEKHILYYWMVCLST